MPDVKQVKPITITIPPEFMKAVTKVMADMQKYMDQVIQVRNQFSKITLQKTTLPTTQLPSQFNRMKSIFTRTSSILQLSIDRMTSMMGAIGKLAMRSFVLLGSVLTVAGTVVVGTLTVSASIGVFMRWIWDKMVNLGDSMLQDYLVSTGTYSTIGGMRAFRTAFGGLFNDPGIATNVAQARADLASRQFLTLQLLGVKNTKDTTDMMLQATIAAAAFMKAQPRGLDLIQAQAFGLMTIFQPETLIALRDADMNELRQKAQMYEANKAELTISDKAVKGWIGFKVQVDKMWAHTKVIVAEKLTDPNSDLVRALFKLSDAIETFFKKFMDLPMVDSAVRFIVESLTAFEKWLEDGRAKSAFEKAVAFIKQIIIQLVYAGKQLTRLGAVFTDEIITPARTAGPTFRPGVGIRSKVPTTDLVRESGPTFRPGITPGLGPHAGPTFRQPGRRDYSGPGIKPSPTQPALIPKQPTPFVSNVPRGVVKAGEPLGPMPKGGIRRATGPEHPRIHEAPPPVSPGAAPGRVPSGVTPGRAPTPRLDQQAGAGDVQNELGISPGEWDAFRQGTADIESSGGNYGLMGGSGGRYAGAYQMGPGEIADTARRLGEPVPSRQQFLQDHDMQERYFSSYTLDHHRYLMRNPKYAAMSPREKLGILGYAHNQGAGGANRYLNTGQAGRDAFGTSGEAYPRSINRRLNELDGRQGNVQPSPTVTPSRPVSGGLLPWPGASSGVPAMAGTPGGPTPVRPPPTASSPSTVQPQPVQPAVPKGNVQDQHVLAPSGEEPTAIIMHHTGGHNSAQSVVDDWRRNRPGVGSQMIVDRDGTVHYVQSEFGYSGTGHVHPRYTPQDFKDLGVENKKIVGIEFIATGDKDITPEQIEAGKRIARGYPNAQIFGHGEVNPGHREADEGQTITEAIRMERASGQQTPTSAPTPAVPPAMKPIPSLQYPGWAPARGAPGTPSGPAVTPEQRAAAGQKPVMYGFKGVGGAFDQDSFEKYARSKGFEPHTVEAVNPAAAVAEMKRDDAARGGQGHYGLYGFSLGAQSANRVLDDPDLASRADKVTVIGPYKSANISNVQNHPNATVIPDASSGNIPSQGEDSFTHTGRHLDGPGALAARMDPSAANTSQQLQQPEQQGQKLSKPLGQERLEVLGKGRGADPRLEAIIRETSKHLPEGWSAKLESGYRPGDPRFHGRHMATDVGLYDPQGNKVDWYQNPQTFATYQSFAHKAREVQEQMYPELHDRFSWGGYYGGNIGPGGTYGAMDLMHFDLGGTRGTAGSFEKGLYPDAARHWGVPRSGLPDDLDAAGTEEGKPRDPGNVTVGDVKSAGDEPEKKPGESHPGFKSEPLKNWPDSKKSEDTKKDSGDSPDNNIKVDNKGSSHKEPEQQQDNGGALDKGVKVENHSDNDVKATVD